MSSPEVPIDVDPETGVWQTDGLPMVYLPRHFLVNNHMAVEAALGREPYRQILRAATEKSAIHWCITNARVHGLSPEATFRWYLKRLSQRGWGQFSVGELDVVTRRGYLTAANSLFALELRGKATQSVCYMFEGFAAGAFRFLLGDDANVDCSETQCAADGHDHCRFDFAASPA